jgi:sugar phosphate isomerase/epimerase
MLNRRSFITSTGLLALGALLVPRGTRALGTLAPWDILGSMGMGRPYTDIGLQLYTVRDAMAADPAAALAKVASIGYTAVEGATYTGSEKFYGMDPAAFLSLLKANGLKMPSSHYRLGEELEKGQPVQGTLLHDWDRAVADAHAAGVEYMVCAFLSQPERGNLDHFKQLADIFNKAAEKCRAAGIQFCYHNHDFEFQPQNGTFPYDILLGNTDPELVKMEMDLYWVTKAGQDPVSLFGKYPGRFALWHLKDMDNTAEKKFTEVGNGVIDFKNIFAHASQAGMKRFFVEQDYCPGNPFDSITQSIAYIKKNLV